MPLKASTHLSFIRLAIIDWGDFSLKKYQSSFHRRESRRSLLHVSFRDWNQSFPEMTLGKSSPPQLNSGKVNQNGLTETFRLKGNKIAWV